MNSIRSYFENKNLKYKNTEDNSTISTNNRNLLLLKTGNGNLASSTADTIAIREGSSDTVFGGSIEIRTTSTPRRAASRTCSISDVNPATYQENSRDELTETVREEGLMVLEEEKSKPEEREIVIAGVRSEMEEETLARVPSNTLVELNRMDQEERWDEQLQSDMFPDNDGGLCTLCIYNPCLCALTKLDMKIKALKTLEEQAPSPPQTPAERGVSSPPTVSPPSVGTPPPHQLQTRVTETSGPLLGTSPSPACGPPLTYPTFPPSNYPPISPHSPISPSTPHSSINVSTPQFINKKQSIAMNHDHSLSTHSSTPASTPHLSASPCTLHSPARKRSWDPENEQSLRRRRNTAIILKDKNILFERKTSLKIPDMWREQMVKKRIPEVRDIHLSLIHI